MKDFITYIDETVAKLQREERQLAATDRKDESNLVKIQINVYGICKTLYEVASKAEKDGEPQAGERLQETYLAKLEHLPMNWKVSYEKAREHNDVEKIVIEELKIQTLETVKNKFLELCQNA